VLWAVSVSFAQVYVGVHFPLDVTVGGIIGTAIGICTGTVFNRYFNLAAPQIKQTASE
jgi:undecaprenyl-diphosphatase